MGDRRVERSDKRHYCGGRRHYSNARHRTRTRFKTGLLDVWPGAGAPNTAAVRMRWATDVERALRGLAADPNGYRR